MPALSYFNRDVEHRFGRRTARRRVVAEPSKQPLGVSGQRPIEVGIAPVVRNAVDVVAIVDEESAQRARPFPVSGFCRCTEQTQWLMTSTG